MKFKRGDEVVFIETEDTSSGQRAFIGKKAEVLNLDSYRGKLILHVKFHYSSCLYNLYANKFIKVDGNFKVLYETQRRA